MYHLSEDNPKIIYFKMIDPKNQNLYQFNFFLFQIIILHMFEKTQICLNKGGNGQGMCFWESTLESEKSFVR